MSKRLVVWAFLVFLIVPVMVMAADPDEAAEEIAPLSEDSPEKRPAEKTLRFISDLDTPPFAFVENFKNMGFEIDLGEALGKEMGRPVKWVKQSFNIPTFASALKVGRADAVLSSMTVTEKRKQYFDFTRPYFRTNLAVAAPRDVDWDKQAFKNGLTSKIRVGVLRRSTGGGVGPEKTQGHPEDLHVFRAVGRALKNREVGIILIDKPILMWTMANRHYKFKFVEEEIDTQDYAIGVDKSNQELLSELNAALEKLDADGVYDRIYEKWYSISRDLPGLGR